MPCRSRRWSPAVRPEQLGDASFRADQGLRYAYLAGAMANGIGSVEIVSAMSRAGMLGFFGAAGCLCNASEKRLIGYSTKWTRFLASISFTVRVNRIMKRPPWICFCAVECVWSRRRPTWI